MQKPATLYARDAEWAALVRFATNPAAGATLGVVSGRRRQGKSYLLQAACRALGGFYFAATEATEAESLRQFATAYAAHLGLPYGPAFPDWDAALDALLLLGRDKPTLVVIDEFPYLAGASPALPSMIQRAYGPLRDERQSSRSRLILCGSAMGFMGRLLSGNAPLRGRAGLELLVPTLGYRQAAGFWGISDPSLAASVHAVVGGTPAYRREFVNDDSPQGPADFDDWICRTVLNPGAPLFREARYLLATEPGIRDVSLYHSVLAAVAEGNNTRGGIAGCIGRQAADLGHPLSVLEDAGLLRRDQDLLRTGRSTYRINEPLITFYHAVMRPVWSTLAGSLNDAARIKATWLAGRSRFTGNVMGHHFEEICRSWAASADAAGAFAPDNPPPSVDVGSGTVNDSAARISHEVDVLVLEPAYGKQRRALSIGEAKWGTRMGLPHLERLTRIRDLLAARKDLDTHDAVLACYSGAGFSDELRAAAAEGKALLVDLPMLYGQSGNDVDR